MPLNALANALEKLNRGQKLSDSEMIALRQVARRIELVSDRLADWITQGGVNIPQVKASSGEFKTLPIEIGRIGSNVEQAIPNTTETKLAPAATGTFISISQGILIDTANAEINISPFHSEAVFLVMLHVDWIGHATGYRKAEIWDEINNIGAGFINHVNPAAGGVGPQNILAFLWRVGGPSGDRLGIRVWQNSGGSLNVKFWRLSAVRVH